MNNQSAQFSLKNNTYLRFKEIFDLVTKGGQAQNGQIILIVDEYSANILSSALTMSDILKFGVQCIEKLELKRKKFQQSEAVYIIEPSQQSVQFILNDFQKKDNPQYDKIHIFFTRKLNKDLLKQLAVQSLVLRIKSIKEIYHDFFFMDQNRFHLNIPSALPQLYSGGQSIETKLLEDEIASKLLTVLPALLNFSTFSIICNQSIESQSNKFSSILSQKIYEYKERLRVEKSKYLDEQCGNVYIMIFDRTNDAVTPLIHDLYYESMVHDLLDIDTQTQTYQFDIKTNQKQQQSSQNQQQQQQQQQQPKQIISNIQDEIFNKYRYSNISDCLKGISEDLQTFAQKNKKMQTNDLENQDFEKTEQLLNQLPQYQEQYEKHTMHLNIIENCYKIFQERNLIDIAELEQKLITGVGTDSKRINPKTIKKQLFELLTSESINIDCKLRLAMISILTLHFDAKEKTQLEKNFSQEDLKLFLNLNWIDKNQNSTEINTLKASEQLIKHVKAKVKSFKQGVDVEFCRHTPEIALQIENIVKILLEQSNPSNHLQKLGFSIQQIQKEQNSNIYLKQQSSNQSTGSPTKHQVNIEMQNLLRDKQQSSDLSNTNMLRNQNKYIIFFLGGIAHSEIRSISQINQIKQNQLPLIIGSTQILTPKLYINGLKQMQSYS